MQASEKIRLAAETSEELGHADVAKGLRMALQILAAETEAAAPRPPPATRRHFLPADDELLAKLWGEEKPIEEIARILGRSHASIYYRATSTLGLKARPNDRSRPLPRGTATAPLFGGNGHV
jgi:hypothetical protein